MSLFLGYDGHMSVIMDGIYISRFRACRDKEFLKSNKITHIINCASQSCASMFPEDFKYLNLPIKDEPVSEENILIALTPIQNFIPSGANFIQECLDSGGRVVVHCRKGISRSVSIVAGFLMRKRGASLMQALTLIRERRKVADPNIWFVENLKQYQHELDMERIGHLKSTLNQEKLNTSKQSESSDLITSTRIVDNETVSLSVGKTNILKNDKKDDLKETIEQLNLNIDSTTDNNKNQILIEANPPSVVQIGN